MDLTVDAHSMQIKVGTMKFEIYKSNKVTFLGDIKVGKSVRLKKKPKEPEVVCDKVIMST